MPELLQSLFDREVVEGGSGRAVSECGECKYKRDLPKPEEVDAAPETVTTPDGRGSIAHCGRFRAAKATA